MKLDDLGPRTLRSGRSNQHLRVFSGFDRDHQTQRRMDSMASDGAHHQRAMVVVALEKDTFCRDATVQLNHKDSALCTHIEREFLNVLEGGCTAPIGAFAQISNTMLRFKGVLFSLDGTTKIEIEKDAEIEACDHFGRRCAEEVLKNGGAELMKQIKNESK